MEVTLDWEGRITGGQLRPRAQKYRWLKGSQLPCDELPLQILHGDPTKPILVKEGIGAKPWWVHLRTGAMEIGIAGGCWNSPIQIEQLQALTHEQEWILLPDGDAIYNQNVLNSCAAFTQLVPGLKVRWWNQFFKGQDADETDDWVNGTRLTSYFHPINDLKVKGSSHPDQWLSRDLTAI